MDRCRFRRQWVVLSRHDPFEHEWSSHEFPTGEVIYWHPDTRIEIHKTDGKCLIIVGNLLHMAQHKGCNRDYSPVDFWVSPECWMRRAAGTYVVLAHNGHSLEIYTDPGAMFGVYYKNGRASSSPALLPDLERDQRIDSQYSLDKANDWYTGSTCPFTDVRFLLANHRLELSSGRMERFWPKTITTEDSIDATLEQCSRLLREFVEKVSLRSTILVSLTGGRDSRVNLAASRGILDAVEFFTIRAGGVASCDLKISADLASRFVGLRHRIVDTGTPDKWILDCYDEIAAGLAVGARRDIVGACYKISSFGDIHLSGALGEVARSYFWHTKHPSEVRLDYVLSKFSNPAKCIREGLEEWNATVPAGMNASSVYNLLYLEQRGGRWAGVGENAASMFYQPLSAFNSRLFFESLCSIPESMQFENRVPEEMVSRLWPELLDVRFCKGAGKWTSMVPKSVKRLLKKCLNR
jgi:hypothetical protein